MVTSNWNGFKIFLVDQDPGTWAEYWVLVNTPNYRANLSVEVSTDGYDISHSTFYFFLEDPSDADEREISKAVSFCRSHFEEFIKYDH